VTLAQYVPYQDIVLIVIPPFLRAAAGAPAAYPGMLPIAAAMAKESTHTESFVLYR
jgi:hypothetical protein